jgi:pyrroline-5-carboxylate reductase
MAQTTSQSRVALSIIGGGNMGSALLGGLIGAGWSTSDIVVVEVDEAKCKDLTQRFGVLCVSEIVACDGAVVAVKPAGVVDVCTRLREVGVSRVLSIAAGITTNAMQEALGNSAVAIRAMPNTPALIGEGASVIAGSAACDSHDLDWAEGILRSVGIVLRVDENDIDAVTAVAGSGPGYVFLMAEAMIDAGVTEGLSREVATALVRQLFKGAGALLAASPLDAETLREQVTSPGGTTAAGLAVFNESGFREIVNKVVQAAATRSREMRG